MGGFILAAGLAGYLIFTAVRDFVGTGTVANIPIVSGNPLPGNDPTTPLPGLDGATPQPWTGADRVTVLLMGVDRRKIETERGYRTDSMMLLTLDPVNKTGGVLSIPRDLWVEIPGFGLDRINTANYKGDVYEYPGGGPALAAKTVQHNLGVRVDYYVRIDFAAFERLIDEIGGIEVEVLQTIDDPLYPDCCYGYEPFYLPAGRQHLNGRDALRYARTRRTYGGDFDRAYRQQQVILAVREKVTSADMLPTLIAKAPGLYQTLADGIDTDLSLDQMISLGLAAAEVPKANIQTAVIDNQYVIPYQTPAGASVLIPLRDKIRELRNQMFAAVSNSTPVDTADISALLAGESARVAVHNGTLTSGLASSAAEWLKAQGVNIVEFGNADRFDYAATRIIDYAGKPYTTRFLADSFHVGQDSIFSNKAPPAGVDIVVIIGQDWSPPEP